MRGKFVSRAFFATRVRLWRGGGGVTLHKSPPNTATEYSVSYLVYSVRTVLTVSNVQCFDVFDVFILILISCCGSTLRLQCHVASVVDITSRVSYCSLQSAPSYLGC